MDMIRFKKILHFFHPSEKENGSALKPRVATRRAASVSGLYKVLDRDKFYGRHYAGTKKTMRLIDISTTGCAFKTPISVAKGSYMEVEFDRLSKKYTFNVPIIIACEAVYSLSLKDSTNRIGAKFLEINSHDLRKIKNFSEKTARG